MAKPKAKKKLSKRQKAAISRANAQKSTGPRTAAGKERSRMNSVKHGLTSTIKFVLPDEDPDVINAHFDAVHEAFKPKNAAEENMATVYAQSFLNFTRAVKAENGVVNVQLRKAVDDRHGILQKNTDLYIELLYGDLPNRGVNQLMVYAKGVRWLLDRWTLLKAAYDAHGYLNSIDLVDEAIRLLGYNPQKLHRENLEAYDFAVMAMSAYPAASAPIEKQLREILAGTMPPAYRGLIPNWVVDPRYDRELAREHLGKALAGHVERLTARLAESEVFDATMWEDTDAFATVMRDEADNRFLFRYQRAAENGMHKAISSLVKLRAEERKALEFEQKLRMNEQKMRHDEEKRNEARERHERSQSNGVRVTCATGLGAMMSKAAQSSVPNTVTPVQKKTPSGATVPGVAGGRPEMGSKSGV